MKKRRRIKNSVVFSWITSYGLIISVFIVVELAVFLSAANLYKKEIHRSTQYSVDYAKVNLDKVFNDIRKASTMIWLDNENNSVFRFGPHISDAQYRKLIDVTAKLKLAKSSEENIEYVGLVDVKNDRIVSNISEMSMQDFYKIVYSASDLQFDEFCSFFDIEAPEVYFVTTHDSLMGASSLQLNFIRTMQGAMEKDLHESVLITIKNEAFLEPMNALKRINNSEIYIIGKQGELLASTGQELYKEIDDHDLDSNGYFEKKIGEKKYIVSHRQSEDKYWTYLDIIPERQYMHELILMQAVFSVSLVLIILCGIGFMRYFVRKNYEPIFSLLQMLDSKWHSNEVEETHNEFDILSSKIESTLQLTSDMDRQLYLQRQLIRDYYFVRLLKGLGSHDFQDYEEEFQYDEFATALFFLKESDEEPQDNADVYSYHQMVFIIKNVIEELISEKHFVVMVEFEGVIACIININPIHKQTITADVREAVYKAERFINDNFNISFQVAMSSVFSGLLNLSMGYDEAMEVMRYQQIMESDEFLTYDEISFSGDRTYYYPFSAEQQLGNLIKVGDEAEARKLVDDILLTNMTKRELKLDVLQHLMLHLMSTINRVAAELVGSVYEDKFDSVNTMRDVLQMISVDAMKESLYNALHNACVQINSVAKEKESWVRADMLPYIDENYQDINLSVSAIADYFQVHPVYVSRLFKEQMGEGLLDYISRYRVEKSKEILKTTNLTLEEVAAAVGYSNSRTFSRVFKKYEKITPGKYREL